MDADLNKKGLIDGAKVGAIGVAISLLFYMMGVEAFLGYRGIVLVITSLTLLILWGRKERNINYEGYLEYNDAFWYCAIAIFIMSYINEINYIFILNIVDPDLQKIFLEQSIEATEKGLMLFQNDQSIIDETITEIEIQIRNSFLPFSLIANSWQVLMQSMFFALIPALFLRKSRPLFEEE